MKLLHSIKIVLLEESLPIGIFGKGNSGKAKIDKIKRFVTFFTSVIYLGGIHVQFQHLRLKMISYFNKMCVISKVLTKT